MEKRISTAAGQVLLLVICSLMNNVKAQYHSVFIFPPLVMREFALCLDQSPFGYFFSKGYGSGANNWLIFFEGDEWCTGTSCETYGHEHTSYNKTRVATLTGILSPYREKNPDFYNWNRVRAKYCDGSSFMGDTIYYPNQQTSTRAGMRNYNVMMGDLIQRGLGNADNAVLAGGSSGGLAAMLHCDRFRESIPNVKRVKCISDSGFFLAGTDPAVVGFEQRENRFPTLIAENNATQYLPEACKSRMNSSMCMNPQNFVEDIKTPLLVIESSYDNYQISSGTGIPDSCAATHDNCTATDVANIKAFRQMLLKALQERIPKDSKSPWHRGLFVHSCDSHTHLENDKWRSPSISVRGKTIQKAIRDWYFERAPVYEVDSSDVEPTTCTCPSQDICV